ncbi:MAG: hypothetical protein JWM31_12 [Solirubrobacterales bacterium]|nr:hypothetical protein [Solirubrobacterales bacterium]
MTSSSVPPMTIRRRAVDGVTVMSVVGELVDATAPALARRLIAVDGPLILDLTRCRFVTAPGCAPLFAYRRSGPVAVVCERRSAVETALLRITAGSLPIHDRVADAVDGLRLAH